MARASHTLFVAVEGPEGAGKTTLVERLADRLRNADYGVVQVREPGGTPAAEALRELILNQSDVEWSAPAELFLILAARAELVRGVIQPALARERTVVVSDRYELSTEVYQVAGRGLPREAVLAANGLATGGLRPDLTLVLDLPVSVAQTRQDAQGKPRDRIERAGAEFHDRVCRAFAAALGPGIVHLDGTPAADVVAEAAWQLVNARLDGTTAPRQG
jgi:dTMP kinase